MPVSLTLRRDERDEKVISLALHIVRNLLAIRDTVADGRAVGEQEEFSHLQASPPQLHFASDH